jgi:endo-1,4-beta-xylanase
MLPRLLSIAMILAAASASALPEGVPLIPFEIRALEPSGPHAHLGRFEFVPVEGQPFSEALRVQTMERPPFHWDVQARVRATAPVRKGDTLWAAFNARRIASTQETGEALVQLIVERSAEPHEKSLERALSVGPEWTEIRIPFVADRDSQPGELQVNLRLGYAPQTIEIGGLALLNFGPEVVPDSLPKTNTWYPGSEPDAAWRSAAAERIERIRKGDLNVRAVDATGQPIEGATVEVRMRRHAFSFGTAIDAAFVAGPDTPDNLRYRETLARYFNKAVFENDLKWPAWTEASPVGEQRRINVPKALDWLEQQGIPVRGHVMVWPSWRYVPPFVRALRDDPPRLRQAALDHIADQTAAVGHRLAEWDVINESYAHHDLMDILGREVMADWFRAAEAGAPNVRLFYNDYTMFSGEGPNSPSQHFYDTIQFLLEQGAPIGGIGEQGHFGGSPPPPERVLATFDRFAAFGLPIQITEFDIDTSDGEVQVAYTRDFLTLAFSHPAVTGVLSWGFWEGRHWKPRAAFWSKDWTLRPNGEVWVDLITRQWWTDADLQTDSDGAATVRGFCGDYEVTVRLPDGRRATRQVRLSNAGATAEMSL